MAESEKFWTQMTIAEALGKYAYVAECPKCMKSRRIDLEKLAAKLGRDFPMVKIRGKLRCECGSREVLGGGIHLDYYMTHMRSRIEG